MKKTEYGEIIAAQPVMGIEGDNADYSKATPAGSLSLTITNPAAFGFFEPGKQYYVNFESAA